MLANLPFQSRPHTEQGTGGQRRPKQRVSHLPWTSTQCWRHARKGSRIPRLDVTISGGVRLLAERSRAAPLPAVLALACLVFDFLPIGLTLKLHGHTTHTRVRALQHRHTHKRNRAGRSCQPHRQRWHAPLRPASGEEE